MICIEYILLASKIHEPGLIKEFPDTFMGRVPSFIPADTTTKPILMRDGATFWDISVRGVHFTTMKYPEDAKKEEDPRFLEQDIADSSESADELILSKSQPTLSSSLSDIDEMRKGDTAIRFWKDLRQGALDSTPGARVEWSLALLLTRKQ